MSFFFLLISFLFLSRSKILSNKIKKRLNKKSHTAKFKKKKTREQHCEAQAHLDSFKVGVIITTNELKDFIYNSRARKFSWKDHKIILLPLL
jgi:hypothetical protein